MMKRWAVKPHRSASAFTLIEVMVVIAIIAVLIAVLVPCLRTARAATKRTVCAALLKQIGTAWDLYLNDSQGLFYQAENANVKFGGWPGIIGYLPRPLNRYLSLPDEPNESQARAFCCPADRGGIFPRALRNEKVYRIYGNSFNANLFLIGQNRVYDFTDDSDYWDAVRIRMESTCVDEVSNPSLVLLAGDYSWFNAFNPKVPEPPEQADWHHRKDWYNMIFVDGHVSFVRIYKGILSSDQYRVMPFDL
jgi:prepilin-type N-terminal cleavage/methylation domain-containing protein/prepilin-type processing-associated H-X9-DG protein